MRKQERELMQIDLLIKPQVPTHHTIEIHFLEVPAAPHRENPSDAKDG